MLEGSHSPQHVQCPLGALCMNFSTNSQSCWILSHSTIALFPGPWTYFCAILGKSKAVACGQLSLKFGLMKRENTKQIPYPNDVFVHTLPMPSETLHFCSYYPKPCHLTLLFLPRIFFLIFSSSCFEPLNSCPLSPQRRQFKIPSTWICSCHLQGNRSQHGTRKS